VRFRARDAAPDVDTSASVMLYVNSGGYAVVYNPDTATWATCSNNVAGDAVTPITSDAYARITLYKNYAAGKVAVFVDGVLVREGLTMISNPSYYRATAVQNSGWTDAYLDDVAIAVSYPGDLTGDSDGDGWYDAQRDRRPGLNLGHDQRRSIYLVARPWVDRSRWRRGS